MAPLAVDQRAARVGDLDDLARGLVAQGGFAADLDAVVDFYDSRFHIGFTREDKADLVAFLRSL